MAQERKISQVNRTAYGTVVSQRDGREELRSRVVECLEAKKNLQFRIFVLPSSSLSSKQELQQSQKAENESFENLKTGDASSVCMMRREKERNPGTGFYQMQESDRMGLQPGLKEAEGDEQDLGVPLAEQWQTISNERQSGRNVMVNNIDSELTSVERSFITLFGPNWTKSKTRLLYKTSALRSAWLRSLSKENSCGMVCVLVKKARWAPAAIRLLPYVWRKTSF